LLPSNRAKTKRKGGEIKKCMTTKGKAILWSFFVVVLILLINPSLADVQNFTSGKCGEFKKKNAIIALYLCNFCGDRYDDIWRFIRKITNLLKSPFAWVEAWAIKEEQDLNIVLVKVLPWAQWNLVALSAYKTLGSILNWLCLLIFGELKEKQNAERNPPKIEVEELRKELLYIKSLMKNQNQTTINNETIHEVKRELLAIKSMMKENEQKKTGKKYQKIGRVRGQVTEKKKKRKISKIINATNRKTFDYGATEYTETIS
jgi:hypothetical protein